MRLLRVGAILLAAIPAAPGCSGTSGGEDGEAAAAVRPDERRYELPAAQVWAATQSAVEEDGGAVELRRPASDGGEIVARRPEGARVQAIVTAVGPTAARASVAVTPPNTALAAMIQGRIGERLSLEKAQAELFGETSVETVYPRSLEASVAAAEQSCRSLDLEIVRRITQESHARVEGRDRSSRAIRFSFRRIGDGNSETAVMFTAESAGEDAIEHLRREFERHLFGRD
jgi:hypothetical protein